MFTGEYRHTIDGKGRVAVPVRFRVQLDGGAFVSRWLDNCLAIFPRAAWDDLAAKVKAWIKRQQAKVRTRKAPKDLRTTKVPVP